MTENARRTQKPEGWSIAKCGTAALAVGMGIAMGPKAEAAIVYTDLDPNVTIFESTYLLNLDADAVNDFSILHFTGSFTPFLAPARVEASGLLPLTNQVAFSDNNDTVFFAAALTAGAEIPDALSFTPTAKLSDGFYGGLDWAGAGPRFLGLAFDIAGNTHYGWARLQIEEFIDDAGNLNFTTTLFDYAYESCPGQPIIAGATAGGPAVCGSAVPTPAPIALLAAGAAAVVALRRLRKDAAKA